jgi:hypothetical protein
MVKRNVLLLAIGIIGLAFLILSNGVIPMVQANNSAKEKAYSEALSSALQLVTIPEGYVLKSVQDEKQNGADVWWFRYEKASGVNNGVGGEHFSFIVTKNSHKLLGFTWMDAHLAEGELPSKGATKEIAKAFLDKVEPSLFTRLDNLWIDQHDESITIKNGEEQEKITISGMKYKCYLKDNDDYAWVIVGKNGKVITFEQGIKWVNGRVTEKWLHDSWLPANVK